MAPQVKSSEISEISPYWTGATWDATTRGGSSHSPPLLYIANGRRNPHVCRSRRVRTTEGAEVSVSLHDINNVINNNNSTKLSYCIQPLKTTMGAIGSVALLVGRGSALTSGNLTANLYGCISSLAQVALLACKIASNMLFRLTNVS